jgi:hypothetical protein
MKTPKIFMLLSRLVQASCADLIYEHRQKDSRNMGKMQIVFGGFLLPPSLFLSSLFPSANLDCRRYVKLGSKRDTT